MTKRMPIRIGWDNGGMDDKKTPHPWLGPSVAIAALVFTILFSTVWAYIQMLHWKEPGADYVGIATNIAVTSVLWLSLAVLLVITYRRSRALATKRNSSQVNADQARITQLTDQFAEKSAAAAARDQIIIAREQDIAKLNDEIKGLRAANGSRSVDGQFHPRLESVGRLIATAFYGSARKPPTDVTKKVRSLAEIGEEDIVVNHYKLCDGHDPDEGEGNKFLTVTFSDTVRQGGRLNLPMDWLTEESSKSTLKSPPKDDHLTFLQWHSGNARNLPREWPEKGMTPTWVSIKNLAVSPSCTAKNVTVRLDFVNSAHDQLFTVPEAPWYAVKRTGDRTFTGFEHCLDIEGDDEQSCVLFVTDSQSRLWVYKRPGEPVGILNYDHWTVKVFVTSENIRGFEGTIGFTQTKNSMTSDRPAFTKLRSAEPRLQAILRSLG